MSGDVKLSVRISQPTKVRLAQLAERTKRSQSVLVAEAIEEFVSVQEWQIAGIEEALTSLDRGERLAHEDVKTWAATLGSKDRRPKPKSE